MSNVMDFRTNEQKWQEFKQKTGDKVKKGWNTLCREVRNNKDVIILMLPGFIAVTNGVTKVVTKGIQQHTANKELDYRARTIYDHSLGRYVELRKPLTSEQALEIEERRLRGEKLHVILYSMGLLK